MSKPPVNAPAPIAYDIAGAAAAVGLSTDSIREALRNGDLTARWYKSKRLIGSDELAAYFNSLPVDKP